jgi:L-alanine-DL-glutamate epimerase-like enolase superfamily enzyme
MKNTAIDIANVRTAKQSLGNVEFALDLTWLEEPIIPDDVLGHARVLAVGGIPIAAGESLRSLWEFTDLVGMSATGAQSGHLDARTVGRARR